MVVSDELTKLYRIFMFDSELHYERLIARCLQHPTNGIALCNAAQCHAELGNIDEALDLFARAIALIPAEPIPYVNRGYVLEQMERHDEALADYATAVRLAPDNAQFRNIYAYRLHRSSRFDEAIAEYDVAIRLQPDFPAIREARDLATARRPLPE